MYWKSNCVFWHSNSSVLYQMSNVKTYDIENFVNFQNLLLLVKYFPRVQGSFIYPEKKVYDKHSKKFANTLPHSGIRERILQNTPPLTLINREHSVGVTWRVSLKIIVIQLVGGPHFGAELQSLRWRDQKCSIWFSF